MASENVSDRRIMRRRYQSLPRIAPHFFRVHPFATGTYSRAMNHHELLAVLSANPESPVRFLLPDGGSIPAHFHITEVGHVRKDFIDCGGTVRSLQTCLLQAWVASDTDHRIDTTKLAKVLRLAESLLGPEALPVEVEYEDGFVSQFPLAEVEATAQGVLFFLTSKHTDCLAKEKCGVGDAESCCATPGCC